MVQWRNDQDRYGVVTIALHWLVGLTFIGLLIVGFVMQEVPKGVLKYQLYNLHKSTGATLLLFVILRMIWRLRERQPMLPKSMSIWEIKLAISAHHLLYLAMFVMTLSGVIGSYASGYPLKWYGLFELPTAEEKIKWLSNWSFKIHRTSVWPVIALVVLHVLAALKHHFINKDDVLKRMLPWPRSNPSS